MRIFLIFLYFFAISLFSSIQVFAAKILIIESYHKTFQWDKLYTTALKDVLGKKHKLYFFRMDTKRISPINISKRADLAWSKYQKIKPDYVVLGDDNALMFLGERLGKTDTPVIFLGINGNPTHYFADKRLPANITGVLERPHIADSMKKVKMLIPELKRVLILFDNGHTSKALLGNVMRELNSINKKELEYDFKFIQKKSEWVETVSKAKANGYGAIFLGTYHTITDKNNRHVPSINLARWTSAKSEIPVFGFWSIAVGKGKAIGGIVLDGYNQGFAAAQMVNEVIAGKKPPVLRSSKGLYLYSRSELERWNIKLPLALEKKATFVD
ncbi:MAG: ABC transporter substrate-binding protein [Methyloligellaceae bacterium]